MDKNTMDVEKTLKNALVRVKKEKSIELIQNLLATLSQELREAR